MSGNVVKPISNGFGPLHYSCGPLARESRESDIQYETVVLASVPEEGVGGENLRVRNMSVETSRSCRKGWLRMRRCDDRKGVDFLLLTRHKVMELRRLIIRVLR
jgi:hypothetical protein